MRAFRPHRSRSHGFSLIELSVVMAIISVVAVLGLEMTASFLNRTAYETTKDKLAVIKTAMGKYRATYGYLPCTANETLDETSTSYGVERRTGGACTGSSLVTDVYWGDLPVRDLGLPLTYMKDGYGSKFRYVVSRKLAVAATFNSTAPGLIKIRTGKLATTCGPSTACQEYTTPAAYLVLSFGMDKRGSNAANPCASAAAALEDGMIDTANCRFNSGLSMAVGSPSTPVSPGLEVFYDSRYNAGTVEESHFDDLLIWQPKSQL